MVITQKLWESNYGLASQSLNTKFVQGIKNGDLPKTKFQEYLAQDYFFLESFARAYGLAVSKSRNKKNIKTLSVLLSGVSDMLIPQPKAREFSSEQDPRLSFSFSGTQQTSRAGTPVPIVYGEIFTGSVVISGGIDTEQVQA